MALAGVELERLVSEPDALTTRPRHGFYTKATIIAFHEIEILVYFISFNPAN